MLVPSLLALGVASAAACVSVNCNDEIVKVAMAFTAVLSLLLTLFFAPWEIKVLVMVVPLAWERLDYWSRAKSRNDG